jgi:hypothetical protein
MQDSELFDDFVIALDQAGAMFDAEEVQKALAAAGLVVIRAARSVG